MRFQSKNSDFLIRNLDFLLKNVDFIIKNSPAPYTLQGAVALLGGIQRSSLSLVVIILEGTGAVQQLLPIILTTVVAKWTVREKNE